MVIRRVGPLSCAKVGGLLYAVMGLVAGVFFALFSSIFSAAGMWTDMPDGAGMMGLFFGVGAIVVLPICYGILGFLTALIGAAIYNVLAGVVGGVEIDVQTTPGGLP